jgi:hypothetical protein
VTIEPPAEQAAPLGQQWQENGAVVAAVALPPRKL